MKLLRDLALLPNELRGGAVAIGNFDGVHLGHAVHRPAVDRPGAAGRVARRSCLRSIRTRCGFCAPELAPPPLTWTDRKAQLLAALGVDSIIAYPTDEKLLGLTDREFFDRIVRGSLAAKAMVEGPNFFFGRDRMGTIDVLRRYTAEAGLALEVVEPVVVNGQIVSSSRVRSLLAAGQVDEACRMLTQPYRIRGMVTHGAGRGARIGFATANVDAVDTLLPGVGVYAGRGLSQGRNWPAAINLGPNPTFGEQSIKLEVHLIGFEGSLYGEAMEIDFLSRIRDVRPFGSLEELKVQLASDVARAKTLSDT